MFQFPTFAFLTEWQAFNLPGCPIRKSRDQLLFAHPPRLSQLITSFIASESQGIRHAPLLSFLIIAHTYSMWDDIYFQLLTLLFLLCTICHRSFRFSMQTYLLSNQWWRITDSNRWPSACKADALASWANPPFQSSPRQSWTADLYIISVAL